MKLIPFVCSFLFTAAFALPSPSPDPQDTKTCTNPPLRKEWRTLSDQEKSDYITAVKCLQELPAVSTNAVPGAVSRYDDFVGLHVRDANTIHFVGHTLPWHRYFVAEYERAMINECNYTGGQPYWDFTLDSAREEDFLASPIFDPGPLGFGGNGPWIAESIDPFPPAPGRTGGGCVQDGPFKDLVVRLGPRENIQSNPRCLTRDFSPWIATTFLSAQLVKDTLDQTTFGWFDVKAQGKIQNVYTYRYHGGGHLAIGGELGTLADVWSSAGDPLFYLHHTNMDRLWWEWQKKDLPARLYDISNPIYPFDFPYGNATSRGNVTLEFEMPFREISKTVTIGDTMDIMGETLCYDYAPSPEKSW
ncbi:uncharacterized protein H6S33_012268 [Morchella sextelata]|uniref:uncharacterized protein n=1 Tax=Morchella sextelata TaxID=1174677 RepID=UPI001D05AA7E|nr:uncharacterized protein H6S33_012268 [Morchella sextelata]KAH0609722.1 hypothetical protein H6S33_012268 [Morchella sextelata]